MRGSDPPVAIVVSSLDGYRDATPRGVSAATLSATGAPGDVGLALGHVSQVMPRGWCGVWMGPGLSVGSATFEHMFDRVPGAELVVDLVAAQSAPAASTADAAAVDLIEQAMAWERVAAWVESQRLDTLRRFETARIAADSALGEDVQESWSQRPASERAALRRLQRTLESEAGRFAAEEVALALNISPTAAHRQLLLARDLQEVHRDLGEALELGQVSGFVASMIAQTTRKLPTEARRVLDEAVTADAVEQPAGRAIAAARARVSEADGDAEAAVRRATQQRHLYLKPLDDGQALFGAVLPADDALRAFTRCDDIARAQKHAGASAPLDQLRCDAFSETMLGCAGQGSGLSGPADNVPQTEPPRLPRPVTVSVVIALTTLLGLDSKSAWLEGYGTITAGTAQRIVATGDTTIRRLLCDPVTGATMVADPTRYTPSASLAHAVSCRDRRCRLPVCEARIRHLDHIRARADAGLTTPNNIHGLCVRSHLAKHHPGWRVSGDADGIVVWQTPTGHRYPSLPPPATGYGTGPPDELDNPFQPLSWLSRQQQLRHYLDRRDSAA
jgi:Domain of unknown function (DUF222)